MFARLIRPTYNPSYGLTYNPSYGLGYQALLKSYISEGLRQDEAQFSYSKEAKLIAALKKLGVPESIIEEAARDVA